MRRWRHDFRRLAFLAAVAATLGVCGSGAARAQAPGASSPDSLSLRGLRVRGGNALSTGQAKSALGASGTPLTRVRAAEALRRLGESLIAQGYLEAGLRLDAEGQGEPVLEVLEGARAEWGALKVRMPSGTESLAAGGPGFLPGPRGGSVLLPRPWGRFRAAPWEDLCDAWVGLWTDRGYPFAWVSIESLVVHQGRVDGGVYLDPGPPCRVATLVFPGLTSTKPAFLQRWIRFHPGQPYRESEWQARRRRCEQLGLFLRVDDPRPGLDEAGAGRVDLPVVEGKHNRLEAAAGYAGAGRIFSYLVDLELEDLGGAGRSFHVRFDRLRPHDSRLSLQFHEPMLLALPLGLRVGLDQTEQDSTYTVSLGQALLEASMGWDLTAYAGGEYRRALTGSEPSELDRRLSSVVGGRWDTRSPSRWRGGLLDASFRSGRSRIRSPEGLHRRLSVERGSAEAERFWPLHDAFLLRTVLAGQAIAGNDSLSPSEALKIGGASSIRGYPEESFATRRYLYGQIELGLGWPAGRVYAFYDAGWFRPIRQPAVTRSAAGAGLGFSTENTTQRISLDLGVPRGGTLGETRLHLRLETRF